MCCDFWILHSHLCSLWKSHRAGIFISLSSVSSTEASYVIQKRICPTSLPPPLAFLACVSESRTWSVYKFGIKALIVGFLFQSVMPFCPKEVQSFYQVSWGAFAVALRELSSDTINPVLYFWKCSCILSFKTLQSACGKALDDVLCNQKQPH
jgi:hypothetical protein